MQINTKLKETLIELPKDIIEEMKVRFKSDFCYATKILNKYLIEYDYLNSARIIRCVVFLTQNGIENWESNLNSAKTAPRDVMFCAEYETKINEQSKRVRNFNKSFKENAV